MFILTTIALILETKLVLQLFSLVFQKDLTNLNFAIPCTIFPKKVMFSQTIPNDGFVQRRKEEKAFFSWLADYIAFLSMPLKQERTPCTVEP